MRNKVLSAKHLHLEFTNQATEITCDISISDPEDFNNEHGLKCIGIWDTGSESCLISNDIAQKLNLAVISYKIVVGVTDEQISPEYLINLFLPNGDSFKGISALVGDRLEDDECLIGMSIINKGDFAITNVNNKTTMSWRCPSVERINFQSDYEKAFKEQEEINRRQKKDTKRTQKRRKRRPPKFGKKR